MTLRFIDSFDDRDGDYVDAKYQFLTLNWINEGGGRGGGNAGTLRDSFRKYFVEEHTWIVGFALYYHTDAIASFFSFWDVWEAYQMSITTLAGGLLQVAYGAGAPILGVSTAPLIFDEWQYVEIKIFCDAVDGHIEIHLDEVQVFSATGINTDQTGEGAISNMIFPDLTSDDLIDDIYICDGNGTENNTFLGDCHVECVLPNGDGAPPTAEWFDGDDVGMPSIYTQVNDYPPSAWGYNYVDNLLTALPVKDVWAYPDIAVEANHILGVQVSALAQAVDFDVDIIMHNVCRSGGVDYNSTSFYVYNWMGFFDFLYFSSIWEKNPDGPVDWLRIDFNAAEFGYEREELPA